MCVGNIKLVSVVSSCVLSNMQVDLFNLENRRFGLFDIWKRIRTGSVPMNKCSCSSQLSKKFRLLINIGIIIFISKMNIMLNKDEHGKSFIILNSFYLSKYITYTSFCTTQTRMPNHSFDQDLQLSVWGFFRATLWHVQTGKVQARLRICYSLDTRCYCNSELCQS